MFISYSWTSDDYADWIKDLAEKLRSNGVDVVLDRWDLRPGQDTVVFMEQMVTNSEIKHVLLMCDKRYMERANLREGGVGTESTIISQEVYSQVNQEKFIPVITERSPEDEIYLPTFIKSRLYVDISDPKLFELGYEKLLRTLTGRAASEKPPVGKPPAYLFESSQLTSPTTFAFRAFENALMNDRRNSTGLAHDYLDRLIETLTELKIDLGIVEEKDERDSLMLTRLEDWDPLRNEWVAFLRLLCRYGIDPRLFGTLPVFFESILKLSQSLHDKQWNQHFVFIVHEAFLYTLAVLLKEQKFDEVALLLNTYYRHPERTESTQRYGIFFHGDTQYLEYLLNETWSKQENGTKYKHPHEAWLHKRVNDELISFEMLKEADIILWLRHQLEHDPTNFRFLSWFPVTVGSFEERYWRVDNFPVFQRAVSTSFFERFKVVLGVESKDEFLERWNRSYPQKAEGSWDSLGEYLKRVFNINDLSTTK